MTSQFRGELEARAAAYLQAAEACHLKWNGATWTHALHLLGVLTDKERGPWFAAELLKVLGEEQRLDARLAADAACAPRAGG